MAQLNGSRIVNALYGLLSGLDATDRALLARVFKSEFKIRIPIGDQGATATGATAFTFYTNDEGQSVRVKSAKLLPAVTMAPSATDNCAFILAKVDSAGTNSASVATFTNDTSGGTATAAIPKSMTVVGGTSTVATLASGWSLTAAATKAGSGCLIGGVNNPSVIEVTLTFDV